MNNIIVLSCVRSGHNHIINQIKSWKNSLIYNFEDVRPANYERSKKIIVSDGKIFNPELETINIIVVRDLLNWWASYLKWITKDGIDSYLCTESKLQNAFNIWNDIVKEAYTVTTYIQPTKPLISIDYDLFNKSKTEREWICYRIGGVYNENSIDLVSSAGGGSSFDKQKVPGTKLKTNTRYKQINSNLKDLYIEMLTKNKESINLYKKYFCLTEDQEQIINPLLY